jgi:hypothetical protein
MDVLESTLLDTLDIQPLIILQYRNNISYIQIKSHKKK